VNAITVSRLVKRFGAYTAVDGVSFDAPSGQVTARTTNTGRSTQP
jgi:ABC-type multidrug transport system ATPase subunit